MKKLIPILAALMLSLSAAAAAQTTTARLQWDQPLSSGQAFADVQAFSWTLKVDAAAAAVVTPTCVAGAPIRCTVPLPPLSSAPHTLIITASNGFGSASSSLSGNPPASPVNITVVVTVTVP